MPATLKKRHPASILNGAKVAPGDKVAPSDQDIRVRACEIYKARIASGQWGDALSDWLQAERELRARVSAAKSNGRVVATGR